MPYIIEKTFNSEIFTKVGNPTITADGIASGFSSNSFLQISINLSNKPFIFETPKFVYSQVASDRQYLFTYGSYNINLFMQTYITNTGALNTSIRNNNTDIFYKSYQLTLNNSYQIKYVLNNTEASIYLKTNDNDYELWYTTTNTSLYTVNNINMRIGQEYNGSTRFYLGSIDLKQFKITVDGKVVLNGTTSKEVYVLPSIQEIKDYYSNTLIVQYHDQPKAKQTIEMLVYLVFSEMLLFQVQNAFNWKTAVGKQLDIIGQWVGVSRTFNINLLTEPKLAYPQYDRLDSDTTSVLQGGYSDYETFGTLQGGQLRYSDIQTTTNNLNDDNYRIIIGLKIIFNSINHTAKAIDDAIWEYFNHEVYTVWTDNTLTYYYPSNLAQVMLFADYKGVLPAPTGVTVQLTEI